MKSNSEIKDWITCVVDSCLTWDQITTAERLINNFKIKMEGGEYDTKLTVVFIDDLKTKIKNKKRNLIEGKNLIICN